MKRAIAAACLICLASCQQKREDRDILPEYGDMGAAADAGRVQSK